MTRLLGLFAMCLLAWEPVSYLHAQSANPLESKSLYQELQQALDALARVELAREHVSLTGNRDEALVPLRQRCRETITQLRAIEQQLEEELRRTYQQKPSQRSQADWTLRELESLTRNIRVQLARAYRNQALCYPDNSADRANSLNLALEELSAVIGLPLNETIVWQARVEQVACLRLLDRMAESRQQVARWSNLSPPPSFALRFTGELLRIETELGDIHRALALVDNLQADDSPPPETDDAILATLLAARQQAKPRRAEHYTQRALQQMQHIAATHGTYWQRRAEHQFGLAVAERSDTQNPDLLEYAARSLYSSGKRIEAITMYDRIAELRIKQEEPDKQFRAKTTAAAIARELGQREDVITRFQRLALQHRQRGEAASQHMVAIGLAAELVREASPEQRTESFQRYLALLEEHLRQWPNQPSASSVEQWLQRSKLPEIQQQQAQALASTGDRVQALALYRQLREAEPKNVELMESQAELLAKGTDEAELREALQVWRELEQHSKPGGPRWTRGRQARLALLEQLGEGGQAEKLRRLTQLLYGASKEVSREP